MAGSKVAVELVLELPNLVFTSISTSEPLCPAIFEDNDGPLQQLRAIYASDSALWQLQSNIFGLQTKLDALCR